MSRKYKKYTDYIIGAIAVTIVQFLFPLIIGLFDKMFMLDQQLKDQIHKNTSVISLISSDVESIQEKNKRYNLLEGDMLILKTQIQSIEGGLANVDTRLDTIEDRMWKAK